MKKTLFLATVALFSTMVFTACDNDDTYERHTLQFYPIKAGGMIAYADQTVDTIRVVSSDSWQLTSGADWLTCDKTSEQIPAGKTYSTLLHFQYAANNTGKARKAYIAVKGYGQISMPVTQYYWLNIISPAPVNTNYSQPDNLETAAITFPLNIAPTEADTAVTFTVYANGATLTSNADWAQVETANFDAGKHRVALHVDANHTGAERLATLTLTSNGVSSQIALTQQAD